MSSTKILTKSDEYKYLHNWLGEGLVTSTGTTRTIFFAVALFSLTPGKKWFKRRKLLTPSFHFQILQQFVDVFNAAGETLVDKLKKEVDKESTDIYNYIRLSTLDVACG